MDHMELPHRHGNNEELSRLEHCMQEAESFQAVAGLCRLLSDANRVRIFWLLCHCEECVVNLAALVGMSSPAASHHLRQLKDSGLVVSRRIGKEVYYRAADTEVAGLLHQVIERTVEVTCPREEAMPHAPHLPPVDAHAGEHAADLTPQQREIIHQVHQLLTENLDSRITIEQLSRRFLMNPSTMKELFKAEYGSSIAAHIRQHRMEKASALLLESGDSLAQVARALEVRFVSTSWHSGSQEVKCLVATGMAQVMDALFDDLDGRCMARLEEITVEQVDRKLSGGPCPGGG